MQGRPLPLVELRHRDADGNVLPVGRRVDGRARDRAARGSPPRYYDTPEQADRWTDDGWFKTGDVVTIHPRGFIQIKDRSKDVIKSGGEWISSVELENALMAHPAIAEAAVIAVPDPKWDERPLAAVVLREGQTATAEELREFLAPNFAKWWLPDRFEFVAEIPKTSVGKFRKTELREMFAPSTRPRRHRDQDRLARQPAGQRRQRAGSSTRSGPSSSSSATTSASSCCAARATGRSRPAPTSAGSSGGGDDGGRPAGIQPVADLIEQRAGPGRGRDPRLLPRRRARDRARLRLPHRAAPTRSSASPRSTSACSRAAAARSARRG